MKVTQLHSWKVNYREAVRIQNSLIENLSFPKLKKKPKRVAGADVSCSKRSTMLFASVVVLSLPDLSVIEEQLVESPAVFPYIPGLLSFREIPILCKAFRKIKTAPEAVICDGQGIAHPRGIGLAAHLGLILNIPTVGCAKSRLVGEYKPVGEKRWSRSRLRFGGKNIGSVVRSRRGVKPVFISPGNNIDLQGSIKLIRWCTTRYRLPEPTRLAHISVNRYRRLS